MANAQKQHKSMRGRIVDMDLLSKKNELTPAVGNARVNARGDELGPGGKIVRKREDIIREYYEQNPNAVRDERGSFNTKAPAKKAAAPVEDNQPDEVSSEEQAMLDEMDQEWVEDDDGNFVAKGD
ncbi:MAG: hypothetical protein CMN33_06570 [Saprospirales bacterium]|nr:hypothetical protein [Saprospirales bacterium]|tara:strand:+ start:96 stop:470 length:375 start_codon:yes stop_codon:yes gene_type:complete